ncbi:hypothetical protein DS885_09395 [Psychromonas sp. B3M02]|uniref:PfaB family protein n=1 Tax=Psychromonas sp. B3M02 TaxID=2267226 RepID=UPI000DE83F89|nr:PfaB family protein [Psychromonas sp. B3M02]RBW45732.1 hypothetical protein DS885_09395 [Psychromonas sp. B3M02]
MLAVLGLEVSITGNNNQQIDIDAFDYHLYQGQKLTTAVVQHANTAIHELERLCDKLLTHNHLTRAQVNLIQCCDLQILDLGHLTEKFAENTQCETLSDAFDVCSQQSSNASLIISIDASDLNSYAAILVAPDKLRQDLASQLSLCHCYAYINAQSSVQNASPVPEQTDLIQKHLAHFRDDNAISNEMFESIILNQLDSSLSVDQHALLYIGFNETTDKPELSQLEKPTLLTSLDCYHTEDTQFMALLSLISAVLCMDQQYRLGYSGQSLVNKQQEQEWNNSPYYLLADSTSYLPQQSKQTRHLLLSLVDKKAHQLFVVSNVNTQEKKHLPVAASYGNGFLAQQPLKPFIIKSASVDQLIEHLAHLKQDCESSRLSFKSLLEQHLSASYLTESNAQNGFYCVVLLASSLQQLTEQINLACVGLEKAINNQQAWKTPLGSYCSAQLVNTRTDKQPLSFVYPGVGALYVNMGKDLLRLFPHSHQAMSEMSPDLAHSLQDKLITPRHITTSREVELQAQHNLRASLANIAEAGVSYAYLLTHLFQCSLALNTTSAAGYSMGEVSMFAALGCWKNPHLLSERLRNSPVFTEQLAGPLKRLNSEWGEANEGKQHNWESYHIKAGLMQVKSVITHFPRVFITIQNTADSLVIAGDPSQCLALAQALGVRAIALNVPNIIHCELSRSEYQRMQLMYSLPVQQKLACQLFSSSCYLPVPITEKAIAVSISKCLTEFVDFPRLIKNMYATGERVFIEMGAGKSLSTWIERILKNNQRSVTCLSVNQKNSDDYTAILKSVATLVSLGYPVNLQPFFKGTLVRPVNKIAETVLVS